MEKSSDLLDRILIHGPSQSTVLIALTAMKEEGRTSEVIQGCLKALDIYPDDIRLRTLLAESYQEAGFIGRAEAELSRVTSEIDDLTSAYKLQARIYARQGRLEESFESLKRYLASNPDDQEGLDLLNRIRPPEPEVAPEEEPVVEAVEPAPGTEPVIETFEAEPQIKTATEAVEAAPEEEPVEEPSAEMLEPGPVPEELAPQEEIIPPAEIEEEPEEPVVELATPTLAELYFTQGQIQEAISTYEKVLLNVPDDKASEQRLAELKSSIAQEAEPLPSEDDIARIKTEKTIATLDNWLTRMKAINNG